jgi:hypothetical protein
MKYKLLFLLVVLSCFNVSCQNYSKKVDFASKQLTSEYKKYSVLDKKTLFVYVDLNNCYNCSQGLRWVSKADKLFDYQVFYIIHGINIKKMDVFKKEYNLKNDIKILNDSSWIAKFLISNAKKTFNTSMMLYMDNPYFYSLMPLLLLDNLYDQKLLPSDSISFVDTSYYTSFRSLTEFNDKFYTITSPKFQLRVIDKRFKYSCQINLDSFYERKELIANLTSSMSEVLKKKNTIEELKNNFEHYIKEDGYIKVDIINVQERQNEVIVFAIFNYATWSDTAMSRIRVRPIPAILSMDFEGEITLINPLNIMNTKKDSFFIDYYNFVKLEENGSLRLSTIPNNKFNSTVYYPLEVTMVWDSINKKYTKSSLGKRFKINLAKYDTSNFNTYLLTYLEDSKMNKYFKSHNSIINFEKSILLKIGNFHIHFPDSLNYKYFLAGAENENDTISNILIFIEGRPIVCKINTNNSSLLSYYTLKVDATNNLNSVSSCFFKNKNLYVLCNNNTLNSSADPKIYRYSILDE